MTSRADWLPRANGEREQGELLRRSFEEALESRPAAEEPVETVSPAVAALDALASVHHRDPVEIATLRSLAAMDTRSALRTFARLSPEAQDALAYALELPEDVSALVGHVLALPDEAQRALRSLL